jgi:hypothetical protein
LIQLTNQGDDSERYHAALNGIKSALCSNVGNRAACEIVLKGIRDELGNVNLSDVVSYYTLNELQAYIDQEIDRSFSSHQKISENAKVIIESCVSQAIYTSNTAGMMQECGVYPIANAAIDKGLSAARENLPEKDKPVFDTVKEKLADGLKTRIPPLIAGSGSAIRSSNKDSSEPFLDCCKCFPAVAYLRSIINESLRGAAVGDAHLPTLALAMEFTAVQAMKNPQQQMIDTSTTSR